MFDYACNNMTSTYCNYNSSGNRLHKHLICWGVGLNPQLSTSQHLMSVNFATGFFKKQNKHDFNSIMRLRMKKIITYINKNVWCYMVISLHQYVKLMAIAIMIQMKIEKLLISQN